MPTPQTLAGCHEESPMANSAVWKPDPAGDPGTKLTPRLKGSVEGSRGVRARVSVPGAGTVVREIQAGSRGCVSWQETGAIQRMLALEERRDKGGISGRPRRVSKCLMRHCTGDNLFVTSARDKCRSHCRLGRDSKSSLSWECGPATGKAKVLPGDHWEWGDTCCT